MSKLNEKQQAFADEYIITKNAKRSAIKAGYSENTAEQQGSRLLSNVKVSNYIEERLSEVKNNRLMDIEEALLISASIARGEPQTTIYKELDPKTDEVLEETKKLYTPRNEERQKSLEHILKVSGAFIDKKEISATVTPQFIDDIPGDVDD